MDSPARCSNREVSTKQQPLSADKKVRDSRPKLRRSRGRPFCIDCGAHNHISYNQVCPNYHIHLQQLAAKAENTRKAAAAHSFSSTDRTVALRDGTGEIYERMTMIIE